MLDVEVIKNDPSTSIWLHNALVELEKRDPVDFLRDVEVLKAILDQKIEAMFGSVSD